MNNYEYIMHGGMDALMDWYRRSSETCGTCVGCTDHEAGLRKSRHERDGYLPLLCREQQRKWLESEHIEPDSMFNLVDRLLGSNDACSYFGKISPNRKGGCTNCEGAGHGPCTPYMLTHIAESILSLRGEEE